MTLYVTSASFEDRCVALPNDLPRTRATDHVILIDFSGYENVEPYLFNRRRMVEIFDKKGYSLACVQADLAAPLEALMRVEAAIAEADSAEVLLDISTLPRIYLFSICRLLATIGVPTTIRYYRPLDYGSALSRGIGSFKAIPGFEGEIGPTGETVLAVILGFEGYKALHAWERIGPSRVVALFGDPPYEPEFLTRSKAYNRDFVEQASKVTKCSLHTSDVLTAKSQLQMVYEKVITEAPENSFILCPLGTKLQSLAAFGFAYLNEAVAVAYVSSLTYYTEEYSRGYQREYTQVSLSDLVST